MAKGYTDEFRRDAVRMATSSALKRPHLSSDLAVGLSTLNKWVQQYQHDDLMSGPHEDVEKGFVAQIGSCEDSLSEFSVLPGVYEQQDANEVPDPQLGRVKPFIEAERFFVDLV